MPKSPTITITLDKPYTIEFDLGCIQRMEESTGLGCFELQEKLSELFKGLPLPTKANPEPELSDDQTKNLAKQVRVGFGMTVIAGALGVSVEEARKIVPVAQFVPLLFNIVTVFLVTMITLGAGETPDEKGGAEGNVGGAAEGSPPTG